MKSVGQFLRLIVGWLLDWLVVGPWFLADAGRAGPRPRPQPARPPRQRRLEVEDLEQRLPATDTVGIAITLTALGTASELAAGLTVSQMPDGLGALVRPTPCCPTCRS
jgi:hypothetical protein